MEHYDVIVLGVGSMGGAAANTLAGRGTRVLGLETFEPGHDQGAAHGGSRIIRQSYFESPEYVPLLQRAYEGWRTLEAESGRDIMRLCGGIYIGDPADVTFAGSKEASELHGLDHEILDAAEIRRRFPTMRPADDALAVYEANAGYVRPEETTIANAEVAARKGATLRFHEPVTHWQATPGGGVEVVTTRGTYGADRLVATPGPWARQVLPELALPLSIDRMVFYWFTPEYTDAVPYERYTDERHPVYIESTHGNGQIYGFPMSDGAAGGLKLGFFRKGSPTTPQTIDRTVHADEIAEMRERALQLFPHLTGPLVQAKTCLYSVTPDEHFVIGTHPGYEQVSIACGFSGHGFKFVPVVGEILADLALTGGSALLPPTLFDPTRAALQPAHGLAGTVP